MAWQYIYRQVPCSSFTSALSMRSMPPSAALALDFFLVACGSIWRDIYH